MDKNYQINFVKEAISDTQLTIRALDVKVGVLLVALLSPLSNTHRIFAHLEHLCSNLHKPFMLLVAILFLLLWILALVSLMRAIAPLDNPSIHIVNSSQFKGAYYGGGLFNLTLIDAFKNREITKASKDVTTFASSLPKTLLELENELVFEQMKLIYIREVKLHRLRYGLRFSEIWFVMGIAIYLFSKYGV